MFNKSLYIVFSASLDGFDGVTVEYVTLPGWQQPTTAVRKFEDLHINAQNYVLKIEQLIGVPGKSIILLINVVGSCLIVSCCLQFGGSELALLVTV